MQHNRIAIIFLALTPTFLFSCKKPTLTTPTSSFTQGYDVYIAGDEDSIALYWKNGVRVSLTNTGVAYTTGIAVVGTDVFVSGQVTVANADHPVYWKNGTRINLSAATGYAIAYGIAVMGPDVYVAGAINEGTNKAVYWKNGAINYLSPNSKGEAYSIACQTGDVGVAGDIYNTADTAAYWQNADWDDSLWVTSAYAVYTALTFSNGGAFLCGNSGPIAFYVKYGNFINLPSGSANAYSSATAITVVGSDVYVAGTIDTIGGHSKAVYWKNGEMVPLQVPAGTLVSNATGIAVAGGDVYVIGGSYGEDFLSKPVCWKNGTMLQLAPMGFAAAIAVAPANLP